MRKLFTLPLLLFFTALSAQDTTYIDRNYRKTPDTANALYYQLKERTADNPDAGVFKTYYMSGQMRTEEHFTSFKERIREGKRFYWREDGSLWREREYVEGKLDGYWISYWENGQLKRQDFYEKGELKDKNVWDMAGNRVEWYPMEVIHSFPGGRIGLVNYLRKRLKKGKNVKGGRVVVEFVVEKDGSVTNVRIKESDSPALNLTAFNVVSNMPDWQPGQIDGMPIRVNLSLPLNFQD